MRPKSSLTASMAAELLGVTRATLYSYVSRGLIRSDSDARDPRKCLYNGSDVEALKRARDRGRKPQGIATAALDWGTAGLPSSITLVAGTRRADYVVRYFPYSRLDRSLPRATQRRKIDSPTSALRGAASGSDPDSLTRACVSGS
jgi:DNA-binding transcriptional MerR regulator